MIDSEVKVPMLGAVLDCCKSAPDKILFIDNGGRRTSCAGFIDLVSRACGRIRSLCLPSGSAVAINLPNSVEYVACEFATWLSGCYMVPLNPLYPEERIKLILDECKAAYLIDKDELPKIYAVQASPLASFTCSPEDTAAVFYTSGSTGRPKGVVHSFASFFSRVEHWDEMYKVAPDDVFGIGSPMAFIASAFIFPYLREGAAVAFFSRETMLDISLLQDEVRSMGITCAFFSPSILRNIDLEQFPSLRTVFVGSEKLSGVGPCGGKRIVNMYGMTETGAPALFFEVDKPYDNTPLGKPLSGVEVSLAPDGELLLRGTMTSGYFGDESKTAALFDGGWLHTGDTAKMLPDGNLLYMGRKDWMCKINGQRVESGEVAATMKSVPGVLQAAVKPFTDRFSHSYLVGYYVSDSLSSDELHEKLVARLPAYMVPSHLVRMEKLPLNVNGKMDMASLRSPLEFDGGSERKITAPETEFQKKLCSAFETVLGIAPIGIDDDFFSMGGDSIRVINLQKNCAGLGLSASAVYRLHTVRRLSEELSAPEKDTIVRDGKDSPLSSAQMGIFAGCVNRRGEVAYNNAFLYRLSDRIDSEKFANACTAAVKAHPGLFTVIFTDSDGNPRQRIGESSSYKLELETLTDGEFASLREKFVQPFDLFSDRLFRLRLVHACGGLWLFADFHHIVFDGTSNGVIISDIEAAYNGQELIRENFISLDVAATEEKEAQTPYMEDCRRWNLEMLSDFDSTSLPDPDTFGQTVSFARIETSPQIGFRAFSDASARLGVTENTLALAAFAQMLGSCQRSMGASFATVYNGRKDIRTLRTVAMMVTTLPVSLKWSKSTTVGEYLGSVGSALSGAMAHDLYPFSKVCADTGFDSRVIFTYQGELLERPEFCGESCTVTPLMENATGEPLTVQLYKIGDVLSLRIEYRSDMYSEGFIRTLAGCYSCVLGGLCTSDSSSLLSTIDLVDSVQASHILEISRGPVRDWDLSRTVVGMIREQAVDRPDARAVVAEDGFLTYSELDRRSDALASYLVGKGVAPDSFVAVMMPRSTAFPVAFVACFKCGAAYVPMDYEYPVDRLQYMLEDSRCSVLLTTGSVYRQKCSESELKVDNVVFLDEFDFGAFAAEPVDLSRPDGLAYMIYTSGTTGKPKGVMIEHHGLTNLVHWYSELGGIVPGTPILEHASFSFDGSVTDLVPVLASGGELHIIPSAIRKDIEALCRYIEDNSIEGGLLTTRLGMLLLGSCRTSLRYLVVGGEKLTGEYGEGTRIINAYGPTEFTVASSYFVLEPGMSTENIPIGRPVPNTCSAIVDPLGRLLPQGIPGELVLSGAQTARGYWNRADITAERFTPCPFLNGERMYHTGDLARWDNDGNILYLGRMDTQVKLRGFRIELGEVESTVAKYNGVKTAVAAVKEIGGTQHLCAYYCSDEDIDSSDLRSFVSLTLTDYMVPTAFVRLESMPLTPNGKVDMKKLPVPEIRSEEVVPPSNDVERSVFDVVAEALGTDSFGVTSNLISMGMTSLGAIGISLKLEKRLSLNIPSSLMLEKPTIREWLQSAEDGPSEELKPYPVQEDYPLTDNQTGLYIFWEQHRDGTHYNMPCVLHFKGVDSGKVAEAARSFVDAHPYVKTRFRMSGTEFRQVRGDSVPAEVSVSALEYEPDIAFFRKRVHPFDLNGGPMYRLEVYSHNGDSWLFSDFHHIISDGASENIFISGVSAFLNGVLPEPETYTAFDWSLHYAEWKKSASFVAAGEYFSNLLEGVTYVQVPSCGTPDGSGLGVISRKVSYDSVKECCRRFGVTPNAFFLTAVTQVLHRLTREKDLAVLTVSSGRSSSALARSEGMFVQTLPVVSRKSEGKLSEILSSIQGQVAATLSNDKYPFSRLVEDHGVKTNIMVAYEGDVLDVQADFTLISSDSAKMPLSLVITPRESDIELDFEYDRSLLASADIEIFASALKSFADNMAVAPAGSSIDSVSCVSAGQSSDLLAIGRGESMPVNPADTVVTMFRRFVQDRPDACAVKDIDSSLTYSELDRRSDILAAILFERGLGKDDFVALMLPRRKEFCIAFLAAFKCCAAYVPMDSEYPAERLQYMLEDSSAKVLVTTRELYKDGLGLGSANVVFIDEIDWNISAESVDRSDPGALAYMIYTSGTTGRPKGVMIEQHSLVNMVNWFSVLYETDECTRFASYPSFSFDASIVDLMTAPCTGGELLILDESLRKDPASLAVCLNDNAIQNMTIPTQAGMLLLNSFETGLRHVMVGGEKLSGSYSGKAHLYNGYGPSEFTVCSSYYEVVPGNVPDNIPIGRAVPNTISAIVDPSGNLIPKGAAGEIVLVGAQLARGYWNRPDITDKRFVPCPFVPGQKMYRTGDLARWNDDGELLFMGRIDTQVKLRGFRIELGEIESVIASFPGVSSSVSVVKEINGTQRLCAYFTAKDTVDTAALRSHLSSRLTSYMVPDALTQLDSLPLTPNGKIDLKSLPEPDLSSTQASSNAYEAPDGELETIISEAFATVLGLEASGSVGRNDSFFLMGGTSLQVMKVIVRLSDAGHQATYGDIFKYPTPRTLAAFLEGVAAGSSSASSKNISDSVPDVAESYLTGEDGFDYSVVNSVLSHNVISDIGPISSLDDHPVGDVLLLGSTGYLGIHVLHELLVNGCGRVTCVIRAKKGVTCEGRLKSYLMYYFGTTYSELFGDRITVVEGDMSDDATASALTGIKVDTVINCAANVKHFAAGDEIEKINVRGTAILVDFCLKTGARLIQTSTYSISGLTDGPVAHVMGENDLYFGQIMMTKYQQSKFEAERMVLDAVGRGLKAKIMRLGNLMPRYVDGEFQINIENNGFMARMRAYYLIGCMASSHLHTPIEFAPIDETASAILTLARTPDRFTVFHPFNNHQIYMDDVASIMRGCGLGISTVDDSVFSEKLSAALEDDRLNPKLTTLMAYSSHNNYLENPPSQDFTMNVLNAMDWRWSITGARYLRDVFDKLNALMYFDV